MYVTRSRCDHWDRVPKELPASGCHTQVYHNTGNECGECNRVFCSIHLDHLFYDDTNYTEPVTLCNYCVNNDVCGVMVEDEDDDFNY